MSEYNKTYRMPNATISTIKMKSIRQLLNDAQLQDNGKAQAFHTSNVLRRILKYWAFRTGLTNKIIIAQTNINKPRIVLNTPYAKVIFYGKTKSGKSIEYTKTKHPLAGPRPDKALQAAEGTAITADLQRYIKQRSKL